MKSAEKAIQFFYTIWVVLTYIPFMVFAVVVIIIAHNLFNEIKAHCIVLRYCRWWAAVWAFLCGIRIKVKYNPSIKEDQSYVFVSNHCSNLDAMVWAYAARNSSKGLAKKELLLVPFLGYIFSKVCVIVDRGDKESRRKSMELLKAEMKKGISLLIFPEGTRNKSNQPLQSFHSGAFRIAVELHKPIVPVVICNSGHLIPPGRALFRPGTVKCIFLEPISVEGKTETDIEDLKSEAYRRMEAVLLQEDVRFASSA
ncbi:MAG: 1-acyl-sn-glycerol-3-phosphate acyltransferase [Chitinophagales bacterium]|nr:MAG: 1-acyl-sn-glycerol-3-phosphate acyltransferase [Chitinophagales bacterium]